MPRISERTDARANRLRLIEAAHAVFRERGLDAEMKEIAERAGVGIGTIYRNFPTKDDLVAALLDDVIGTIRLTTDTALRVNDPVEALRVCLRGGFAVVEQYGDLFLAMMQGHVPPVCDEKFEQVDKLGHVAAILRTGIERGIFRADLDPQVAAAQFVACFVPWHYQELRRTRTQAQIVQAVTDLFLRGILADPSR